MKQMNFDKWIAKAEKKIAKMSPMMKLALFDALESEFTERLDGNEEIIHFDMKGDVMQWVADTYDIFIVYEEDDE